MTRRHQQLSASFRDRLKAARKSAGITQMQLAARLGYQGNQAVSNLERGQAGASTVQVEQLALALNVSPEWLAFGHRCAAPSGSATGWGIRLKHARQKAGYTMERLAELLGYRAAATIAHLESEQNQLDLALSESAARVLRVKLEWLAFGHSCER